MHKVLSAVLTLTLAALLLAAPACGDDDDGDATTTTTDGAAATTETPATTAAGATSTTSADSQGGFPSEAFCDAQADLEAAQDGAQRNTAIGEMQAALTDDAPPEIGEALDTLLTGDLGPEAYTAAAQTLADVCA